MAQSILRLPIAKARTGLSRSSIYQKIAQGTFPKPIRLGLRSIGFVESEIEAWIESRIKESRNAASGRQGPRSVSWVEHEIDAHLRNRVAASRATPATR